MNASTLRRALLLVATLAVVVVPLAVGGWYVLRKHTWAQEQLAQLAPRYARLTGMQQQRGELQTASQQAAGVYDRYVYPVAQDEAQTGNQVQQSVRDIFSAAGLQVISSQVLPAKEDKGFDRVPLSLRAEGELLAVQSALAVLGHQQPVIFIDELNIQLQGSLSNLNPRFAPRLIVQFTLSVLRERP